MSGSHDNKDIDKHRSYIDMDESNEAETVFSLERNLGEDISDRAKLLYDILHQIKHYPEISREQCERAMRIYPNMQGFADDGLNTFTKRHWLTQQQNLYVKMLCELAFMGRNSTDCDGMKFESRIVISKVLLDVFRGERTEIAHAYYVDGDLRVIGHMWTRGGSERVYMPPLDVCKKKPYLQKCGVFIAHNHINNNAYPSEDDGVLVQKIGTMLGSYKIKLLDMFTVTENTVHSYYTDKLYVRK